MQRKKNKEQPINNGTVNIATSQTHPTVNSLPFATVHRRKFGTSPFDEYWLNVECCGLFCALLTYCLHFYGVYAVCWILIPPWMSYIGTDGIRKVSSFRLKLDQFSLYVQCKGFRIISLING